jgi:hypothetical protein
MRKLINQRNLNLTFSKSYEFAVCQDYFEFGRIAYHSYCTMPRLLQHIEFHIILNRKGL